MSIESRHLDYDDLHGIIETWHYDHATGEQWIDYQQDVTDIIELNKAEANDADGARWGDGKRVARIPALMVEQMRKSGQLGPVDPVTGRANVLDSRYLLKYLDDPANRDLRTFRGLLSR
jgi:hypothetical protein